MSDDTNMREALKPCPFCEGACAITKGWSTAELPWSDEGGDFFRAYCARCQSRQLFHRTEADAIAAWNRRTDTRAAALEDQLEKIRQWCDAYPLDIFPEPTSDQWAMLHEAAKAFSPGIDRFSASNMRHVVNGVRALAAKTTEG